MNGVKNMSNTLMATPRKFSMQQVFELLLRKPSNRQIIGYLTDLKTSGLKFLGPIFGDKYRKPL